MLGVIGGDLPPKYAAELTKLAKINAKVLLACSSPGSNDDSPVKWTAQGKPIDGGVQLYVGHDPTSHNSSSGKSPLNLMCGVVYIQAPLHEVIHALGNLTTNPYFQRFVEDAVVIGSRALYDMDKNDRRATRIQWMAIRSASSLMQHRDFVVVQHQDDVVVPSRRNTSSVRGWVSCIHSVKLPMVPPFAHTYVRGGIYAYVLKETHQRNVTEAAMVLKVDFKGFVPRLLCNGTLKAWIGCVGRMAQYFRSHQSRQDLPRVHVFDDSNATETARCAVCDDSFGMHSDKRSCRKCHQLDVVGRINVVVCIHCARAATATPVAAIPRHRTSPSVPPLYFMHSPPPPRTHAPQWGNNLDDASSPRFTHAIPMRLSAASWMDTWTDRCEPPSSNQDDGRPRHRSVPSAFVCSDSATNGEPSKQEQLDRSRHSLSPTGRPQQTPLAPLRENMYLEGPPIRLASSGPAFSAPSCSGRPLSTWLEPTTTTAVQWSSIHSEDSPDSIERMVVDECAEFDGGSPRCSDAAHSVVEALTTTGNVLDLTRGDVASFRL
ncbi:hypothetical protein DYB32_006296 [Aphanomyces invadans]|uniref:START domain-containing protein n=1 Tax=Aphanomyces invadans TaxID=157072 RepID=A0A3R6VV75_9STRA|nr:hypothetical protein DYB32_006296 [Aphanomyces invadans]